MDNIVLRKVQLAELIILDEIKRICDLHGIKYYLAGGTLLGAARHTGFIPWDDDLDISMPRKDFERFAEICKTELDCRFELQSIDNEPKYNLFISKVRMKNTRLVDKVTANLDIKQGIYVDIFPLDFCDGIDRNLIKRVKMFSFLAKLKAVKIGIAKKKSIWKSVSVVIIKALTFFLPLKWINETTNHVLSSKKHGSMYINFCSQYGYKKQRLINGEPVIDEETGVIIEIGCNNQSVNDKVLKQGVHDILEVVIGPIMHKNYEKLKAIILKRKKEDTTETKIKKLEKRLISLEDECADITRHILKSQREDEIVPMGLLLAQKQVEEEITATQNAINELRRTEKNYDVENAEMLLKLDKLKEIVELKDDKITEDIYRSIVDKIEVFDGHILKYYIAGWDKPIAMQYTTTGKLDAFTVEFVILEE